MTITNTIRHLKGTQPERTKVEKLFAKESDQVLLSALANPEHSQASRDILQALADVRKLQSSEASGWARTEDAMYVAPFGRRPSYAEAQAAPSRRRWVYRSLQLFMFFSLFGAFFAFSLADSTYHDWVAQGIDAGEVDPANVARLRELSPAPSDRELYQYLHDRNLFAENLRQNYQPGASEADIYVENISAFETGKQTGTLVGSLESFLTLLNIEIDHINALGADNAYAFNYFKEKPEFRPKSPNTSEWESLAVVLLIGGPALWLFAGIFSWSRPCRILLLRPFQAKKISKPLKRFAQKNLAFYGHTFTLSDKYVKESFWVYVLSWIPRGPVDLVVIPLFFIPAVRQFQRWIRVSSPSSYRFLRNRLARRFTMNLFWQNSINKLLKVKCSDVWWKQAVELLMYSCQVIIVDMSLVKSGTEWELEKIDRSDLERKTLFVVSEDAAEYAREVIAKFWPHLEAPPPLYVYKNSGDLLDHEAYHREIARVICESHLWENPKAGYV